MNMAREHRVKRAIIPAAGIGKRMQPLTFTTPKPLVKVRGERMIDTVIRGLHLNGIHEIHVVVGHLKEQFYDWAKEWPGVDIIENPDYLTCNNISSLYAACHVRKFDILSSPLVLIMRSGSGTSKCALPE